VAKEKKEKKETSAVKQNTSSHYMGGGIKITQLRRKTVNAYLNPIFRLIY